MTTWIENPEGGRARGTRALVRSWTEVLVRPGRFFVTGVGPGDQAPGLTFAMAVAVAFATGWFATAPSAIPAIVGSPVVSAFVALFVVGLLAAPVGLHLTAALAVVSLAVVVRDRGGVSETVQVVAYAAAPFALAGPPIPALRVACGLYAAGLLVYGLRTVHNTSWLRAAVAATPAALVGYGVGYRTIAAARGLFGL
ncbi:MAG: YIP1 family protein [Halopenitus sp.]